jgi:hypothetical protein
LKGDHVFKKKPNYNEYVGLKDEIEKLLSELEGTHPGTKEYNDILDTIIKLDGLNHSIVKKSELSKDAILAGIVSILGIVLVINTETVGAITTKAFSLVKKA